MTNSSDLALLRTQPNSEQLFLSVYQPTVLFSAQSSSGTSQGSRIIPYFNSSGSFSSVFHNSVLLVGTTPGASDVGRVRIRSVDASKFTLAENYDIPWQTNLYITAINYIDLNPIYPVISGSSITDLHFWKDYDVSYTNQNSVLGSFPIAGSHQAAFISGSSASIYWSASGTSNVKGDSMTYAWVFEGGSPGTYSGITPGYVNYSTPGHYKTTLTVTGSGGSVDITYRFVSIYPRAANGNAIPPFQRWSTSSIQGSRSEAGYSVAIKVYDQIDKIYDGALVILFTDQTSYGNTKAIVGNSPKFVGYIQKGTIVYDYETSSVEFNAISVTGMLKDIETFSVSCNDSTSPTHWYEILNMSIARVLYHYLRWHTTVLDCTDFQYTGDDRIVQYFDSNRDSIYDAISTFLTNGIIGEIVSDRQGRIWAEINPGAVHNARTTLPVNMSIKKQDWMGEPSIDENITRPYSALELGGVVYNGITGGTGTSTAILSIAPGFAPGVRGKLNYITGFIGTSQGQLNNTAGDLWAYLTARYAVTLKMAGNYNNIDIAPIQQCLLNVSGSDTNRGITFLDEPFHPVQMDWTFDAQNASLYPQIKFAQVTNGMKGKTEAVMGAATVPIPPTIPPIIPPPIPPYPSLPNGKTYTWIIGNPAVGGYPGPHIPGTLPIKRIDAAAFNTSVTFNIEQRNPVASPGTDIMSSDLTADSSAETVTSFAIPALIENYWLWLDISSASNVSGTSAQFVVTLTTIL
jgi:hypothetical protein